MGEWYSLDDASQARIVGKLANYCGESGVSEGAAETLERILRELNGYRENRGSGGWDYVAVDIDGTVASAIRMGKYPDDYMKKKPIEGAVEGLRRLRKMGYKIMFFTARPEQDRSWTEAWLTSNGFSGLYDSLVMDKPHFVTLIDDRAIGFTGNWTQAINEFKQRFTNDEDNNN